MSRIALVLHVRMRVRRMRLLLTSTVLIALGLLSATSPAHAVIVYVVVEPAHPTESDTVVIWVDGYVPNTCWSVDSITLNVSGNVYSYFVNAVDDPDPDIVACAQITLPYRRTDTLGILPAGVYAIEVEEHRESPYNPGSDTVTLEFTVGTTTDIDDEFNEYSPTGFAVRQNYPNPFNSSTVISFDNRDPAPVRVIIYNVIGQPVFNWRNDATPPGRHTLQWNGTDELGRPVPTGIYFYRVTVGSQAQVRKMILLR